MDNLNNANNFGSINNSNIVKGSSADKKFAIAALVLAVPAVFVWLFAALWTVSGFGGFKYFINVAGVMPIKVQALFFIAFPVFALASAAVAYGMSRNKLNFYSLILGLVLVMLALLVIFR